MTRNPAIPTATPRQSSAKQVGFASFIGTTIEWYDFFLYGTAAALVFGPVFFPDSSPAVGVIAAFATYAVGFLARPLGGIVGGHLGDSVGRKRVLVVSLTTMGAATMGIGLLPTHAQVGLLAPVLLLVLRLIQGLAVGAEWGGAAVMSVEFAPTERRGLYGSFTQMGVSSGMLLATSAFAMTRGLTTSDAFMTWGWRLPFLASGLLVVLGLIIRMKLSEPTKFAELRESNQTHKLPVVTVLRTERRAVILTTGMRISQNAVYYIFTVFALVYIKDSLGEDSNAGLIAVMIASAIGLVSVPLWAMLSDRVGRRPVFLFGAVTSGLFILPFFGLVDSGSPVIAVVAIVIGMVVFHDAMYAPQAAFFSEMFTTRVRFSGASLGYQIGSVLGGGFSPLIATSLLALGGGSPRYVVIYFIGLSVVTALCAYLAPETYRAQLDEKNASDDAAPVDLPTPRQPAADEDVLRPADA
ncbi:MHS family MFS transporter [Nocardioides sp. JQ2195]|uniref:MFS transporter n=1 Tax=Nocardioides sp. JQ2195 TaxID=2592334 RepID=UPI00143E4292|nr:MFS transporter [Nocardioides sp. JQ2195]QIX27192.1 MHS family MFS transporter [Nocardioides sp. JQ2195]